MKHIFTVLLLFMLLSCTKKDTWQNLVDAEIEDLETQEDQKAYLVKLYNNSEGVNQQIKELETNYFSNTREIYKIRHKKDSLIPIDTYRAERYLDKFPYPLSDDFSENEKLAIYFTILNEYREAEQVKYLDLFQELYDKKILPKDHYLGYLSKIYYLTYTKFYHFDRRHSIDEMIKDIYPEITAIRKNLAGDDHKLLQQKDLDG